MDVYSCYKKFLNYKQKRVKSTTFSRYLSLGTNLGKHFIGQLDITALTALDVQQFIDDLNLKNSSRRVYVSQLKSFFDYLERFNIAPAVDLSKIELPYEESVVKEKLIPQDKINYLLTHCPENYQLEFEILTYCGLRLSEMLALQKGDFDMERCLINVNKNATNVNGKIVLSSTKNRYSVRKVPFPPFLKTHIKERMAECTGEQMMVNIHGGIKFANNVRELMNRILGPGYSPHGLRHAYITRCIMRGVGIESIKKLVGHSPSSNTVYAVYTHLNEQFVYEDAQKLFI